MKMSTVDYVVVICLFILAAVLAANGRLQNVVNAFIGAVGPASSVAPMPATTTSQHGASGGW